MADCLVTKLNVSVDNPSLAKLGELSIPFIKGTAVELRLSASTNITVSIDKTKFSNKETNSVTVGLTQETLTYDGTDDCVITISNKYVLKTFNVYSGDVRFYDGLFDYISCAASNSLDFIFIFLQYSINLSSVVNTLESRKKKVYLKATNVKGSIDNIKPNNVFICLNSPELTGTLSDVVSSLENFTLENTDIVLNLSTIQNCTSLIDLNLSGSTKTTGNISSLGNLRVCSYMNLSKTQVSGTLESLGDAQYNSGSGRTSGFVRITGNGIITYDNDGTATVIPDGTMKRINFSSSGYTIVNV